MSIFHNIYQGIADMCFIWCKEMKQVLKDEGVLIFFIVVPIVYPLLYSWIYNNEAVHEVPVCVVDQSHSALSRQFLRMCDASSEVRVAYYAQDLDEAKSLVSRQLVKGVYLIPADFETRVLRLEQGTISVYCDMSLMLTYKAIFQTAQAVTMQMGSEVTKKLGGHYTAREEVISSRPLDCDDVPLFNPQGGYGSSVLPAVLMLILQQTLVLGIGLSAGTARDENIGRNLIPVRNPHYQNTLSIVFGKSMCYVMIFSVMGAWLAAGVPRLHAAGIHDPLCARLRILRHGGVVYGEISRECHAARSLHICTPVVYDGRLVAAVQHSRNVAGCLMAVPLYVRSPCLRTP